MPGTLDSPVLEQLTLRYRKVLVGADVTDRGDLITVANEADRLSAGPDTLDDRSLR
jgi:hypothetical protein